MKCDRHLKLYLKNKAIWTQLRHSSPYGRQVLLAPPTGSERRFTFQVLFFCFLLVVEGVLPAHHHHSWHFPGGAQSQLDTQNKSGGFYETFHSGVPGYLHANRREAGRGGGRGGGRRDKEEEREGEKEGWEEDEEEEEVWGGGLHTFKKKEKKEKNKNNGCTHLYPEPKHRKQHSLQMSRLLTDESQSQTGSVPLKSDT